jgi:hypothetical protein
MSQEFLGAQSQSKEIQKVIDLLEKNNIVFEVEGDKILIKGDPEYADFVYFNRPTYINTARIVISQGDNDIDINVSSEADTVYIAVRTPSNYVSIAIPRKYVHVQYKDSYLVIDFSPKQLTTFYKNGG